MNGVSALDSLLARGQGRRYALAMYIVSTVALVASAVSPVLAAPVAILMLLAVVTECRFRSAAVIGMVTAVIMLLPGDIRLGLPLPMEATPDRIVLLPVFFMWALGLVGADASDEPLETRAVGVPLIGLLLVAVVSLLLNMERTIGRGWFITDLKGLLVLFAFSGTYFLTLALVRDRTGVELVARVAVGAGAVAAASAVVERFTLANPIRTLALLIPLMEPSRDARQLVRGAGVRVAGTGEHAIAFGAAMAMLIPLAVYFTITAQGLKRLAWAGISALLAAAMLFTVSRSALISAAAGFLVMLVLWPKWRKRIIVAAVIGLFATHMFVPGLLGTFRATLNPSFIMQQETNPNTASARVTDYPIVAKIVPRQPLFGLGYADFAPDRYIHLDNQLLKFLLEVGVAGTAMILLFIVRGTRVMASAAGAVRDTPTIVVAFMAGVVAFAVQLVFFDTFGFVQTTYLFFILAALGVRSAQLTAAESCAFAGLPPPVAPPFGTLGPEGDVLTP